MEKKLSIPLNGFTGSPRGWPWGARILSIPLNGFVDDLLASHKDINVKLSIPLNGFLKDYKRLAKTPPTPDFQFH